MYWNPAWPLRPFSEVPGLRLISPPIQPVIDLAEAKKHLRVNTSSEDDLIEQYVAAATSYAEAFTGRSFIDTVWEQHMDQFPVGPISLIMAPLLGVESMFYRSSGGDEIEITDFEAEIGGTRGRVFIPAGISWPTISSDAGAVRIRYRAGYVDLTASPAMGFVPQDIRQAILLILGSFYANRENEIVGTGTANIPINAETLLRRRNVELPLA